MADVGVRASIAASALPNDILAMGAGEIVSAVKAKALTPTEVLDAFLERIDDVEDSIRAWSVVDIESARDQAAALTAKAKSGRVRPLHGVPVGVKDEFHIAGMRTPMRGPGAPPESEDAACVARLRQAGAIVIGKTTMALNGRSPATRNPWNLEHTPGGSSNGSAAAVASRMIPIALGEQTGGSNLRPAAYTGLAGMKPSYGRVSRVGCYPIEWSRDHVGLIGLSIADLALLLSVLSGPDGKDPVVLDETQTDPDLKIGKQASPRIGVVQNFFLDRALPEMREVVLNSAERMRAAGARVSSVQLPEDFDLCWHAALISGAAERSTLHSIKEYPHSAIAPEWSGQLVPANYYVKSRLIRTWLIGRVGALLSDYDALLMPAAPGAAPKGLDFTGDPYMLIPWSFLGLPAITINGGLSTEGLPLGLQFVGRPRADYELLCTGAWCEDVLGRLPPPPIAGRSPI